MLKLKVTENPTMGGEQFEIVENDRGAWEIKHDHPDVGLLVLVGFGDENSISIHLAGMQDGSFDIVIVHACCDNPADVVQETVKTKWDNEVLTDAINRLLTKVCRYPEYI